MLAALKPPAWLPNAISSVRLVLLPVWAAWVYGWGPLSPDRWSALAVLVVLGVSDVLDGALARRFGLTSTFGAALDAIADKLAQVLVFTSFALAPPAGLLPVPLWFVGLLILRDATMIVGLVWIWRRRQHFLIDHRGHGKLMSFSLFALMLGVHLSLPPAVHRGAIVVVALIVLGSAALYVRDGVAALRRAPQEAAPSG